MKKMLSVLFVLMAVVAPALAFGQDTATKAPSFTATIQASFWNRYMYGNGIIAYDKPVLQTDVYMEAPNGYYVDWLNSLSLLDTRNNNFGNENNLTAGKNTSVAGSTVNIGITYYDLIPVFSAPAGDLFGPYLEISRTMKLGKRHTVTPYLRFELYLPTQGVWEETEFYFAGIRHAWQITPSWALAHSANMFHERLGHGLQARYMANLNYIVNNWLTLTPLMIKVMGPLTPGLADDRKTDTAYGASASFFF